MQIPARNQTNYVEVVKIASKKVTSPQFSVCISDFLKVIDNAKKDYLWNREEVNRLDKLTQDYLHKLELEGLRYKERAKVATQIADCRQLRRASKDTVEILEPLVAFLESDKGRNMVNLLGEALGKTRRVEERMGHRIYRYRVLSGEGLEPDGGG